MLVIPFAHFDLLFVEDTIRLIFAAVRFGRLHGLPHRVVVKRILHLRSVLVLLPFALHVGLLVFAHQAVIGLEVVKVQFDVRVVDDLDVVDVFVLVLLVRFLAELVEVHLRLLGLLLLLVLIAGEAYHVLN